MDLRSTMIVSGQYAVAVGTFLLLLFVERHGLCRAFHSSFCRISIDRAQSLELAPVLRGTLLRRRFTLFWLVNLWSLAVAITFMSAGMLISNNPPLLLGFMSLIPPLLASLGSFPFFSKGLPHASLIALLGYAMVRLISGTFAGLGSLDLPETVKRHTWVGAFHRTARDWFVKGILLKGRREELLMDVVKDLQKSWIPDHPRYARAKKNALTYLRKAAGLAADSGDHAILLGFLEREGFAKVVQELGARIQCRGEVRRQIDMKLVLFRERDARLVDVRCTEVGCTEGALVSSFTFSSNHGVTDLNGDFHVTRADGVPLKKDAGMQMARTSYAVMGRLSMPSKPLGEIALRILRRA